MNSSLPFLNQLKAKRAVNSGHVLVALLVTVVVTTIVGTALVALVIVSSQNALSYEQSIQTHQSAESGIEIAIRSILRNPNYTGETLQIDDGTVTIDVSGDSSKQIVVTSEKNDLARKIEVSLVRVDGMWEIQSWQEIW